MKCFQVTRESLFIPLFSILSVILMLLQATLTLNTLFSGGERGNSDTAGKSDTLYEKSYTSYME